MMNDNYRGLRVFPKANPTTNKDGRPVPTATVRGCNGLGAAYLLWDDGIETLVPLNEVETYGQYDRSRI